MEYLDKEFNLVSHIEAIWNIIESKIKSIYHAIPHNNYLKFAREA